MKKNYLLFTVLSSLLLAGCGNDESSTSVEESNSQTQTSETSSSSSAVITIPTVAESVAHISNNYTIAYTFKEGNTEYSFRNELEALSFSGEEGNVAYFSEFSESGYYLTENDSYIIYNDGYGKPIYTTNGKLENAEVAKLESLFDIKSSFSNAEWELGEYTADEFNYFTRDKAVIEAADFLTDYIARDYLSEEIDYVGAKITKKGKNYRIYSFTTYNEDGDQLIEGLVQRVGGSMALDYAPVLNNNLDETFRTKWLVASEYGNDISTKGDYIEVTKEDKLYVYAMDPETGNYTKKDLEFTFVAPAGDGSYLFADSSKNFVTLQYYQGDVMIRTLTEGAQQFKVDLCIEYYTYWFMAAADYFGYYVEEMLRDDQYFDQAVTQLGAVRAYYAAKMEFDETTGEEYATELVIVSQFLNQDALMENFCEGDETIYNGFVLGGLIFGNMIGAMATEGGMDIMFNISSVLPPDYAPVIYDDYISKAAPTAGQSASDYLVAYMTAAGYSYMNKETAAANPDFSINTSTNDPESGLNFNSIITRLLGEEMYGNVKDDEGNTVFKATDMYIFYKKNTEQDPNKEGDEYLYAGVLIVDRPMDGYVNFYGDVFLVAMGFFVVSGEIYGALQTWKNAQPNIDPAPASLKKLF